MFKVIGTICLLLGASPAFSVTLEYNYRGKTMKGYGAQEGRTSRPLRMALVIDESALPGGDLAGQELSYASAWGDPPYPDGVVSFKTSLPFSGAAVTRFSFLFDDDKMMSKWNVYSDDDCYVFWGSDNRGDYDELGDECGDGEPLGGYASFAGNWTTPVPLPLGGLLLMSGLGALGLVRRKTL